MSILKFEPRTPRSLYFMCQYLIDKNKTSSEGIFAIGCNPKFPVEEMQFIQDVYYKQNVTHPYMQVIFAFDVGVKMEIQKLKKICYDIGQILILDERQLFGAIHYLGKDSNKIHCHYLINYYNIYGERYKQEYSLRHYKEKINFILINEGLTPIIMYTH